MKESKVILVDEKDEQIGVADKITAHQDGNLHRAFSIFIFNGDGEMLLQQRALSKYHSGGLWTNACCSHPMPGEITMDAATRRLNEELGFQIPIEKVFDFIYKAEFDNGLTEHEFDHVYIGKFDGQVNYDKTEVMDIGFYSIETIRESIVRTPEKFTVWFRIAFSKVEEWWDEQLKYRVA